MADVQLYGLAPWGHHLTNVLLHAFNTVLVFQVFRKLTGADWRSLVIAGLFGLHPLRVESVAWISERKDVLSTMFWLLALWAYASYAEGFRKREGKPKLFYCLTLMFFIMGLMSKAMLVTLPIILLLLDYWPLRRWKQGSKRELILEKIPFFLLTIVVSVIAYAAQYYGGTMQEMSQLPFTDRIGNALISYVRYLAKFFWPENLCIYYPHPGHWPTAQLLAAGLVLACVSMFAWALRQRQPYLLAGWLWYLGALLPVIGLVQLYSQSMADRYTYVPQLGLCMCLVWGLSKAASRWQRGEMALAVIYGAAMIACVIQTRYEIGFWKDDLTVWNRAIAVTKDNYTAHNNLGIAIEPTQKGKAFHEFQEAVRINPDFADAQRNLARQLHQHGDLEGAVYHYQKSLEIDPTSGWAEYGLGNTYYDMGKVNEAIAHLQKAVTYDPNNADSQNNLGTALLANGQTDQAMVHLQKAVALNPQSVLSYNALALIYFQKGRFSEAIANFKQVLKYAPNNVIAQRGLGEALLENGQLDESIDTFQHILRAHPDFADVRQDLNLAIKQRQALLQTQPKIP